MDSVDPNTLRYLPRRLRAWRAGDPPQRYSVSFHRIIPDGLTRRIQATLCATKHPTPWLER